MIIFIRISILQYIYLNKHILLVKKISNCAWVQGQFEYTKDQNPLIEEEQSGQQLFKPRFIQFIINYIHDNNHTVSYVRLHKDVY